VLVAQRRETLAYYALNAWSKGSARKGKLRSTKINDALDAALMVFAMAIKR